MRCRLGILLLLALAGVSRADECQNVRFGVVGFSDVAAVTALTSAVLQEIGYSPTSVNL